MKPLTLCPLLVMSLKRLLIGSISLSDDSQLDEKIGEEQSEGTRQEVDTSQSTGRFCVLCVWVESVISLPLLYTDYVAGMRTFHRNSYRNHFSSSFSVQSKLLQQGLPVMQVYVGLLNGC